MSDIVKSIKDFIEMTIEKSNKIKFDYVHEIMFLMIV